MYNYAVESDWKHFMQNDCFIFLKLMFNIVNKSPTVQQLIHVLRENQQDCCTGSCGGLGPGYGAIECFL